MSTRTLYSVFSYVLLHGLVHAFPQVVFPFSKNENLGYLDFKLVQKNNTDNELFLSKYMVGHLFGYHSQALTTIKFQSYGPSFH